MWYRTKREPKGKNSKNEKEKTTNHFTHCDCRCLVLCIVLKDSIFGMCAIKVMESIKSDVKSMKLMIHTR